MTHLLIFGQGFSSWGTFRVDVKFDDFSPIRHYVMTHVNNGHYKKVKWSHALIDLEAHCWVYCIQYKFWNVFFSFFSKVVSSQPDFLMYNSALKPIKCNLGKFFLFLQGVTLMFFKKNILWKNGPMRECVLFFNDDW